MPVEHRTAATRPPAGLSGAGIMAALASAFNFLLLNLALLIASLPVITLPIAVNAASFALDRWRREGEDRVFREFCTALRSRPPLRTTVVVGVPLAATALGVVEIRYFLRSYLRHRGDLVAHAGLGLGFAALLITLTALGYVFVLAARGPALPATDFWSLCARLAIRNLLITGPLFLIEIAGAVALTLIDPPLLLLGVPVLLLYLMRLTAQFGLRKAGLETVVMDFPLPRPHQR
jgi:hypothetical protein